MKVLAIPEDPTLDQYILKPIVERLFRELRRPARVDVLQDPSLRGVAQALDRDMIAGIVADNPMIDLFLLVVDRDCDAKREPAARAREVEHPGRLLACVAIEEIEVWLLAIHKDDLGLRWPDVRADCHPKERYAEPFLAAHDGPGRGRKAAMGPLAGRRWRSLTQLCPELGVLQHRLEQWFASRA